MQTPARALAVAVAAFSFASCGGEGGGDLSADIEATAASWLEVDLAARRVAALGEPDAARLAGPRWRTTHVLFRRIGSGVAPAVTAGLPDQGEPEDRMAETGTTGFLAVFELTTRQWALLAGHDGGDEQPLTEVSAALVVDQLDRITLDGWRLDLPAAGMWALACGQGRAAHFSWGNGTAAEVTTRYAVHRHDGDGMPTGPSRVGSRLPNGLGLYDLHGNVWELVLGPDGAVQARGGAWDSLILACRTANLVSMPPDGAHAAVGVRLALRGR